MKKKRLGKSEIKVSPVGLGCWPIAGMTTLGVNDRDSVATIRQAIDRGINFLDTAFCYGENGESDRLIAQAIAGRRDEVVIASKSGLHWDQYGQRQTDGSPERIIRECEESLTRLNTDVIDVFYLHTPDPAVPLEQSAAAFKTLLDQGKIRTAGASNLDIAQMEAFESVCPITVVQLPYNILQRQIEQDVVPWCRQREISIANYWPLMKGLLAGKIRRGHVFDAADKRLSYEVFQGDAFERAQQLVDVLDSIATELNKTVAEVVINWTMHRPGITSVLCGAKRPWQINETAAAMDWQLPEQHRQAIDRWQQAEDV